MDILVLVIIIAGLSFLIYFFVSGTRKKDMYIKRKRHIQAFPPGHRKFK